MINAQQAAPEQVPERHCSGCGGDFPATPAHFYPSHLKDRARGLLCKTCHNANATARRQVTRTKLAHLAREPIPPGEMDAYVTVRALAARLRCPPTRVERDLAQGDYSLYWYSYNNVGPSFALRAEDAHDYLAKHRNGSEADVLPALIAPHSEEEEHDQARASESTTPQTVQSAPSHSQETHVPTPPSSTWRCSHCERDLPATVDNFHPSTLSGSGRHGRICRTCHNARESVQKQESRARLKAVASHLPSPPTRGQYVSLHALAKRLHCTQERIERKLAQHPLPVFWYSYNNTGISFALRAEDARTFLQHFQEASAPTLPTVPEQAIETVVLRTQEADGKKRLACDACGTTDGNMLDEEEPITRRWRGTLCASCYQLVRLMRGMYQSNANHLSNIVAYIVRTEEPHE